LIRRGLMSEKISRRRLDTLLVERGVISSRERARALIMGGKVFVDGARVDKPGKEIVNSAKIEVVEQPPFVSRGGIKLAGALDVFRINPAGMTVLDAGASTGGFTDCLLQRGATKVVAVDVGYGQFHWKLRNDPRVCLIERTNIRYLDLESFNQYVDAAVADLSFISLKLVLAKFAELLPMGAWFIPLVKPQFEAGRSEVGKQGVIRDPHIIAKTVENVKQAAQESGFVVLNEVESSIRGPKGNREFLLHLVLDRKHKVAVTS
jgi:23S rRNA (cytidine1920-2'-O)/16S rRNA (cytidine1409-2'-O)-methyltransferase